MNERDPQAENDNDIPETLPMIPIRQGTGSAAVSRVIAEPTFRHQAVRVLRYHAAMPGPVAYEVEQSPATIVVVTTEDGRKYELRLALIMQLVIDTGQVNPLDQMPIFQISSQIVTQTLRRDV